MIVGGAKNSAVEYVDVARDRVGGREREKGKGKAGKEGNALFGVCISRDRGRQTSLIDWE